MRLADFSITCALGLIAVVATAQTTKPDFSGTWQFDATKSEMKSGKLNSVELVVEQKGASIHVVKTTKAAGKETVSEFNCTTDGKDCDAKSYKVSLWYDGASLVEMDVCDEFVTSTRMTLGADGKSVVLAVKYMSPQAETDTVMLQRKS